MPRWLTYGQPSMAEGAATQTRPPLLLRYKASLLFHDAIIDIDTVLVDYTIADYYAFDFISWYYSQIS